MQRVPRLVLPALAVLALAGGSGAGGQCHGSHHGLSKAQILRAAAKAATGSSSCSRHSSSGRLATAASVQARTSRQRGSGGR